MDREGIVARVSELAALLAGRGRAAAAPTVDTKLTNGGFWLDSIALVDLLIACEVDFGLSFDGRRLEPAELATVGTLARLIERHLAGPAARS